MIDIAPELHAVKYQEKEYSELGNFILDQRTFTKWMIFHRNYKSLNGVSLKLNNDKGDPNAQRLNAVVDSYRGRQ